MRVRRVKVTLWVPWPAHTLIYYKVLCMTAYSNVWPCIAMYDNVWRSKNTFKTLDRRL